MAKQRAKGITFDTSPFNQAAQRIAETGFLEGRAKNTLMPEIAKGLAVAQARWARENERAFRAKESEKSRTQQQQQFEARLALMQKRLTSDNQRERERGQREAERLKLAQNAAAQAAEAYEFDTARAKVTFAMGRKQKAIDLLHRLDKMVEDGRMDPNSAEYQQATENIGRLIGSMDEAIEPNLRILGLSADPGEPASQMQIMTYIRALGTARPSGKVRAELQASADLPQVQQGILDSMKAALEGVNLPEGVKTQVYRAFGSQIENAMTEKRFEAIFSDFNETLGRLVSAQKDRVSQHEGKVEAIHREAEKFRGKQEDLVKKREDHERAIAKGMADAEKEVRGEDRWESKVGTPEFHEEVRRRGLRYARGEKGFSHDLAEEENATFAPESSEGAEQEAINKMNAQRAEDHRPPLTKEEEERVRARVRGQ